VIEGRSNGDSEAAAPPPLPSPQRLQDLLRDAARLGRDDMIPALLQAGAQIEASDERDHTALILASYHGHESTTALLLSLGALPNGPPDAAGSTALMGVAFKGYLTLARMLIAAGAQVDRRNRAGQTALMMAALFGREPVIEALLAAGADPDLRDGNGDTAADLARAQGNDPLAERLEMQARDLA
jgi:ankyrin repeat protein